MSEFEVTNDSYKDELFSFSVRGKLEEVAFKVLQAIFDKNTLYYRKLFADKDFEDCYDYDDCCDEDDLKWNKVHDEREDHESLLDFAQNIYFFSIQGRLFSDRETNEKNFEYFAICAAVCKIIKFCSLIPFDAKEWKALKLQREARRQYCKTLEENSPTAVLLKSFFQEVLVKNPREIQFKNMRQYHHAMGVKVAGRTHPPRQLPNMEGIPKSTKLPRKKLSPKGSPRAKFRPRSGLYQFPLDI